MRTLTITLPPAQPSTSASVVAVLSADGSSVNRTIEVPLAMLPDAPDAEVVVVVPAGMLSWHALELPRGTLDRKMFQESNGARLRAVLEGLLEDRLLDEPSQLHFALAPGASTGSAIWVAVCERAWLQAWLATLEQSARPALRIVPEVAPPDLPSAPADAPALHFIGTIAHPQLLYRGAAGVCVLPYSLTALTLIGDLVADPAGLAVWSEPAVAELAEQHFEGRVSLQTSAQRYLAAAQGAWDLAQFDCSASRGARSRKRFSQFFAALAQAPRWRAARWAVLSLVAVQLGGMALWNWNVQAQLAAKRTAIRALVTSTFTDIQVVVDAPLQMERAVRDLQRQSGTTTGADLETMLVQFYTMAATLPAPTAIDYAGGEVKFKGIDAAAAERTRLSAKLQGLGYTTQLEGDTLVMKQEKTEPRP